MLSASEWAAQQWAQVQLGDRRLTRRAVIMGAKMAAHPEASLPHQMESPRDLRAAYHLLNHPGVTLDALTAPHRKATLAAAAQPGSVVLWPEDTTGLDFTAHPKAKGMGPLGGTGRPHGLLLHTTLAVLPDTRTVLGVGHAQVVLREPHTRRYHGTVRSPEGRLWEASARAVGAAPAGVTWVHVGDRGADVFEYLAVCRELGKHFLIRVHKNRVLDWDGPGAPATRTGAEAEGAALLDYARSLPPEPGSEYTVAVPAHDGRPARVAHVVLQWAEVVVPPPRHAPKVVRAYAPVRAWIVRAWEPDAPAGVEPVEWVLLSSLPVHTLADAQRCIDWYTCRWLCEDFHQCLKTGCQVERRQLDDGADIQRFLGFAVPIAARLLQLRQAVRHLPQAPATDLVEPLVVQVLARRQKTDWRRMTAEDFWQRVSRLAAIKAAAATAHPAGARSGVAGGFSQTWRRVHACLSVRATPESEMTVKISARASSWTTPNGSAPRASTAALRSSARTRMQASSGGGCAGSGGPRRGPGSSGRGCLSGAR